MPKNRNWLYSSPCSSGPPILRIVGWGICVALLFAFFHPVVNPAAAQISQNSWSPYLRVPGYADSTYPPVLVADQDRQVHAFAAQLVGDEIKTMAIVYRKWSLLNQWSVPVDIHLAPERLNVDGAYLDEKGAIHLIFWQSGQYSRGLFYTAAPVLSADRASAWSEPQLIDPNAVEPSFGVIFGDSADHLVILYNGNADGSGVYVATSDDHGASWSDPLLVFPTIEADYIPVYLEAQAGTAGKYHIAWNVVDKQGKDITFYYMQYNLEDHSWSRPISLGDRSDQPAGFGTAFPVIFEQNGIIVTVYNDGIPPVDVPPALYTKTSGDGGISWLGPSRIFPQHVGRSGEHAGALDSRGKYHLLFVQRIPVEVNGVYQPIGGIWHSEYDAGRWSAPEQVTVKGKGENYAWHDVNVAISQGNVILAVWRVDPGFEGKGVWYSYKVLDAPETPILDYAAIPTATSAVLQVAQPQATLIPTPTAPRIETETQPISMDNIVEQTIVLGLAPVFLVFILYLGWRQYRKPHPTAKLHRQE